MCPGGMAQRDQGSEHVEIEADRPCAWQRKKVGAQDLVIWV